MVSAPDLAILRVQLSQDRSSDHPREYLRWMKELSEWTGIEARSLVINCKRVSLEAARNKSREQDMTSSNCIALRIPVIVTSQCACVASDLFLRT